jgi:3-oxoacyl-[acyl-carrier protein] reductase
MNLSLKGINALVGGASAGIGQAVAVELALLGANVTLLARTESRLVAVKDSLSIEIGQQHGYVVADYANTSVLMEQVEGMLSKKPIHILVNNTGGPPGGPIVEASEGAFLEALHNHLICNHLLAQAVLPGMKLSGFGRIINVISTSVKEPIEGLGVSNTTRWAVASWAKTLSQEVGQFGITVNNVLPGFTETSRLDEIVEKRMAKFDQTKEMVTQSLQAQVPAKRFATPAEIAAAVAFLATPAAAYINGINLPVDGGRTKSL